MKLRVKNGRKTRLRLAILLGVLLIVGVVLVFLRPAAASFLGNVGNIAWGDTGTGRIRVGHYNFGAPGTFSTSFRPGTAPSASAIQFTVNKSSPTRNEKLIGYQLNNGRLYVANCINACSANANLAPNSWSWSPPTIVGTNTVNRSFDIAYEQLSGRAMVVYAGNTTGKLYYCIYDGTSWGPEADCAPTNGVNDIDLTDGTTSLSGTPEWVRLVPQGEQLNDHRSNNILLAVQDSNNDAMVMRWDGTQWVSSDSKVVTTTGGTQVKTSQQSGGTDSEWMDVGWESVSGTEMTVYADGTNLSYRTSTGSGWSAGSTIQTLSAAAQWVRVGSDPQSNRMSMITAFGSTTTGGTATAHPYVWKADGTTASWTTSLTTLTMVQDAGQNVSTAWEKGHPVSGTATPQAIFSSSASANGTRTDTATWTQSGGLTTWTAMSATGANDSIVNNELTASPNSDIVNMMQADRDGRLRAWTYSGSAWNTTPISTNLTTSLINETTTKANNQTYIQKAYQFSFTPYAIWSMNWRVYDDESATGDPSVALAPEGVTPAVVPGNTVRLRMNYAELGGNGEGDTRKKLQYASGAGCPDSSSCVWTDVDATGGAGIWRYASGGVADNATIAGTLLDASTAQGYEVTSGTASASGDQQNAGDVQEYDYTIQNNGATIGNTYYFRGYDYGPSTSGGSMINLNAIPRYQLLNTAGTENTDCTANGAAANCTYPSILSYTSSPQAPIIYQPLDGDSATPISPIIQVRTSDQQGDYVQYVIEWCVTNSWPCATTGGSFDQTASQSGWSGQDANSGTAYNTSSVRESGSSMGEYYVSPGVLQPNSTYYIRAKAIDPGGSNTYSPYSSVVSFTTSTTDVRIQGGATINGGTIVQ